MAVYAIGDVQGCYTSLRRLLDKINFDSAHDQLWFTGDLVNRGADSAAVVRFVAQLGSSAVAVLGNHDLHLLAVAAGATPLSAEDTFNDILRADDSEHLLTWLAARPIFHHDPVLGYSLVHAGLLPQWDIRMAQTCAREVESLVQRRATDFFRQMYGDMPNRWSERLNGIERMRLIVNAFTRLRYCYPDGTADYKHKGPPGTQAPPLLPWFQIPDRASRGQRIIFGHWSTLGLWDDGDVIGLDTGCLWDGRLTALRLSGGGRRFISVACATRRRDAE